MRTTAMDQGRKVLNAAEAPVLPESPQALFFGQDAFFGGKPSKIARKSDAILCKSCIAACFCAAASVSDCTAATLLGTVASGPRGPLV